MTTDEHCLRSGILLNRTSHLVLQILLKGRILDNWHNQFLIVAQVPLQLVIVDALDHLQVRTTKDFAWPKESGHNCVRGMCMDNCPRITMAISQNEKGRALALGELLVLWGLLQVLTVDVLDEQVIRDYSLLLHTGWRNVNLIAGGGVVV